MALGLGGCGPTSETAPKPSGQKPGNVEGKTDIEVALAKLPPADQEAARKQQICPVSGEPLGSMGTPEKVEVKGQEVFICCAGCEKSLKNNPDKYLAKLSKK
jgi:YHS domain-containing protein